jgi:hypothetical protein
VRKNIRTENEESDDYPSEETLARIKSWPHADLAGALDFVASVWHWPEFGVSHELKPHERFVVHAEEGDKHLRLATGGWSGNEDILAAMQENMMLIAVTWRVSGHGGLHIFQYPSWQLSKEGKIVPAVATPQDASDGRPIAHPSSSSVTSTGE